MITYMESYIIGLFAALLGGFFGALFATYIPQIWFSPRLQINGIDSHGNYFRILVTNKGRTAAINVIGRVTIRPISKDDVIGKREDVYKIHRQTKKINHWGATNDVFIREEEWDTGIEMEPLHWAASPSEMKLTINPKFSERLQLVYNEGDIFKIASENIGVSRVRLKLDPGKVYYGFVMVSAENAKPSQPYYFKISLSDNGNTIVKPHEGNIPSRINNLVE